MVIGGIAIDDISLPDTQLTKVVGGSAIYGSLASSLFVPTVLGGVLGRDFPNDFLTKLKNRGVNLNFLQRSKKPSFRWKARYSNDLSEIKVTSQQINAFAEFNPDIVVDEAQDCGAVFISNIDPEIQLQLVNVIPKSVIKILDSMDIWMIEKKEVLLEVIKKVDVICLSHSEAGYLVENDKPLFQIIDRLLALGPKVLVIKKGEYGLSIYGAMGTLSIPSYPLTHVIDPSGAGDAFGGTLAGVLTRLGNLDSSSMATAAFIGSTIASFVVEGYATETLMNLTKNEVMNRSKVFLNQIPQAENINLSALIS